MIKASTTLYGTIVGAGILSLPFVISQSGFKSGILTLIILGIILTLVYLYLGEVVQRTPGKHQLTGYAEKYLGSKILMAIGVFIGNYGALTAYLIGISKSIEALIGTFWVYNMLAVFLITSYLIYGGLKIIKETEFWTVMSILILISIVIGYSAFNFNILNIPLTGNNPLAAYGAIMFAFIGAIAIPEMNFMIRKKSELKKSIIIAMITVFITYFLFSLFTLGAIGSGINQIATISLSQLNPIIGILGNAIAILVMFSSFIIIGLSLKDVWHYDYKKNKTESWLLTIIIPILALLITTSFERVISITGAIAGTLNTILIIYIAKNAKKTFTKKPSYEMPHNNFLYYLIIIALLIGGILAIW